MYLNKDITRPYVIALKGDPIEVISCSGNPAIIIKCNGVKFAVNIDDICDVKPGKENKVPEPVTQLVPTRYSTYKPVPVVKAKGKPAKNTNTLF